MASTSQTIVSDRKSAVKGKKRQGNGKIHRSQEAFLPPHSTSHIARYRRERDISRERGFAKRQASRQCKHVSLSPLPSPLPTLLLPSTLLVHNQSPLLVHNEGVHTGSDSRSGHSSHKSSDRAQVQLHSGSRIVRRDHTALGIMEDEKAGESGTGGAGIVCCSRGRRCRKLVSKRLESTELEGGRG
jgi:hypothetical protein